MSFVGLPLGAVIALAAAGAAAVLLLYLLKSTPRPQPVSNVDFWLRAAEQAKPAWMLSTRIPLPALLLTLLIALLLVLLAADPRADVGLEGTTVVVLDAGRSMGARLDGGTRLDRAAELTERTARRATIAGRVAVIRAGLRPSVLLPLTESPEGLDRALRDQRPDGGPSDLSAALELAGELTRKLGGQKRIVLISDRRPPALATGTPIELISVGRRGEDLGIVLFGARRDPIALGEYVVLCEVEAFTKAPARARLVIEDQDMVVAEERLELEPGEKAVHRARGFSRHESELTARLVDIEIQGSEDAHPGDDRAYAVVPPLSGTRVLLVSRENRYIETALELDPTVDLERIDPEELEALVAERGLEALWAYHVLILDRFHPARPLHHAGQMLIDPPDGTPGLRQGRELASARVTSAAADHPVLEAVDLQGVHLERSQVLLPEPEDRVVLRSDRSAVATSREERGVRRLVLGFDLHRTDLVRGPAFPLMMHNAVVWLANAASPARSALPPGAPLEFAGARAAVELPGGGEAEARAGAFYRATHAGLYRVNDRPRAVSAVDHAAAVGHAPVQPARQEPFDWPPLPLILGLALLALLLGEWVLLHRGVV